MGDKGVVYLEIFLTTPFETLGSIRSHWDIILAITLIQGLNATEILRN